MKKILKFGCGPIAYNDNFICSGGNKIGVINPETDEVCATLTGIKNISSLSMDEKYIYAKSTTGVYGMFDLETNSLIHKGSCRGREYTSHDGDFFCINEGIILDILSFKDKNIYAVKYNFFTNDYEKVFLTDNNFTCYNRIFDNTERKIYFLFTENCCLNKKQTNCRFFIINVDKLIIEKEFSINFEFGIFPVSLIHSQYILLNNMEILDIITNKRFLLDSNNYYKSSESGYFLKARLTGTNLILVFSETIFIYNFEKRQLTNKFNCEYCFNAKIINNKLYIATWNGLFLIDK